MPRGRIEERLDALEADVARADDPLRVIEQGLRDPHYRVVALAARFAGDRFAFDCIDELREAYARLLDKPVKRDPNCYAKRAIVRALNALDCDDADFYLAAIRYRQPEPVWGGTADTAAELRSHAAMGLVATGYPRALLELTELLVDDEASVRAAAVRAITCGNPREAELVLRLKVVTGDDDPLVFGECFDGLLAVEPETSADFVGRFLDSDDETVAEAAALALGASHLPRPLELLQAAWDLAPARRTMLVRAVALHRSDEAIAWLLGIAAVCELQAAVAIVEALAIYRANRALADKLASIVRARSEPELDSLHGRLWAGKVP